MGATRFWCLRGCPDPVMSDHFTQDSDVDVLIEFEPGQVVGLLRFASIEIELSDILGRKVDLRTPADLSRYFRSEVLFQPQRFSILQDDIIRLRHMLEGWHITPGPTPGQGDL